MKLLLGAHLGQHLHLTPKLLQSIRLLQMDSLDLEKEIRKALDENPLLQINDHQPPFDSDDERPRLTGLDADQGLVTVAHLPNQATADKCSLRAHDEERYLRIPAGCSSDPHLRLLEELQLDLTTHQLEIANFWLEHTDDSGYLTEHLDVLYHQAQCQFKTPRKNLEAVRQHLLNGDPTGVAAKDLRECLQVQLRNLPGRVPGRPLALRLIQGDLQLLATQSLSEIARHYEMETVAVSQALRLIQSLNPRPIQSLVSFQEMSVIPDVITWYLAGKWHVALNPESTHRLAINQSYETAISQSRQSNHAMKTLLQEARWLIRGLSMRYDTLLRTTIAIIERQNRFLTNGPEAMAPLTLKEIADAIGMHESTISRITTGKYLQTPRGTFELKHFFGVRLDGADVSGPAIKAMVKRLIDNESPDQPIPDDAIAKLLGQEGVNIARRTVAKYREQLDIAPARQRRKKHKLSIDRVC